VFLEYIHFLTKRADQQSKVQIDKQTAMCLTWGHSSAFGVVVGSTGCASKGGTAGTGPWSPQRISHHVTLQARLDSQLLATCTINNSNAVNIKF
jgi:hypothetical protein